MDPKDDQPDQPDSNAPTTDQSPSVDDAAPIVQDSPSDALSRTPDELAEEEAAQKAANPAPDTAKPAKKDSALRRFLRRFNVYFLMFLVIVIIVAIITTVTYLNSQQAPPEPSIAAQDLTEEELKELANTDASVGSASQTLTIQGSAIIEGSTLIRSNLNVAGDIQAGGAIQGSSLTISGSSNLGEAQINSLQVAQNTAIQGNTTMRDLNVAGTATFSGPITASQLTVTRLILSGNASLEVPNHIRFSGPTPGRSINSGPLGSGGSASVSGSDTAGTVNVSTGNSPSSGCFVRINFRQAYPSRPHVIISPVGSAAGRTQHYVDRDTSGFSICSANAAPANQSFGFDYFVTY